MQVKQLRIASASAYPKKQGQVLNEAGPKDHRTITEGGMNQKCLNSLCCHKTGKVIALFLSEREGKSGRQLRRCRAARYGIGLFRDAGVLVLLFEFLERDSPCFARVGRLSAGLKFAHAFGNPAIFEAFFHLAGDRLGLGDVEATATQREGGEDGEEDWNAHVEFLT